MKIQVGKVAVLNNSAYGNEVLIKKLDLNDFILSFDNGSSFKYISSKKELIKEFKNLNIIEFKDWFSTPKVIYNVKGEVKSGKFKGKTCLVEPLNDNDFIVYFENENIYCKDMKALNELGLDFEVVCIYEKLNEKTLEQDYLNEFETKENFEKDKAYINNLLIAFKDKKLSKILKQIIINYPYESFSKKNIIFSW